MAIYPDKKDGKLTGRFRVELKAGTERYRKRHDTHREAVSDELAVKAAWARGETASGAVLELPVAKSHTIASVTHEARGVLWRNTVGEESAWAHIRDIAIILGGTVRLDTFDTLSMDKVATVLTRKGLADTSVNRYLSHFRTFLVWARDRKYMERLAFDEIIWPWRKETAGRIRWITRAEEAAMKAYLTGKGQHAIWMFIKVGIETGCRRSELLEAKIDQINGTRLHIWETKTDSPRTIPMSAETTRMIRELIETGSMPSKRGLRSWWDRMKAEMNLTEDDDFVFHTCRHTCATRLLDAGVDILIIKEWLGHKRLETTQRYTHVKPKNLEDALRAVGESALRAE